MQPLRFGESFELDPGAYQLRRSGQALRLERIPMEILLLLTEHRGQLVTREQIVERIWGKDSSLDADNSINGAIRKIRQALKDDPEHPRFIETVTGRGYRFIAPLNQAEAAKPPAPALSPRKPSARVWAATGLALLLLAVVGAVVLSRPRTLPTERRVMVAVLPFDNLTGDTRQEYFSDGLTEEMITQLGERDPERLGVIARTSVMHYKNDRAPVARVAGELGVEYVLEGSVRRDPNDIRITAQLIRASDQSQLWARQYDRKPADLLTLQGEIAQAITSEIASSLGRPMAALRSDSPQAAPAFAAYDLYLRGMYDLAKRRVPDLESAVGYFQEATNADPQYARAYAALADAYVLLGGYSTRPPQGLYAKARAAAQRALDLDSSLAEAHTAFALIVQNSELDWQTSEREFRRAIALNPNYATAHHWYAEHLMWRGRFAEALQASERARQLDPLSLIIATDNGYILYCARQYDRAIEKWRSVLAVDPDFPRAHLIEGAYIQKGMLAEAQADLEHLRPKPSGPVYWAVVTSMQARTGHPAEARAALAEFLRAFRREPVAAGYVASAYMSVGDRDQAFAWMERAYAEHPSELISLKIEPMWDPLRGDPRFQRLLERVGLAK
jgi:TolB-like protein/DNA-binding winged helix-turn-helix (wHTH) protein/Flp pilus assembly protein TadD